MTTAKRLDLRGIQELKIDVDVIYVQWRRAVRQERYWATRLRDHELHPPKEAKDRSDHRRCHVRFREWRDKAEELRREWIAAQRKLVW